MPRKLLDCLNDQPGIWLAPIGQLTQLVRYENSKPSYAQMLATLRTDPMRNPILCFAMPLADWTRRIACGTAGRNVVPHIIGDSFVWSVKYGNQRIQAAVVLGYTHIATVLLDTEKDCDKWLRFYVD